MTTLLETLLAIRPKYSDYTRPEWIQGYNEAEIREIEQRHNLSVHGQFREFLMTMGKCSGGLILGEYLSMFNQTYITPDDYSGIQDQLDTQNDECLSPFLKKNQIDLVKEQYFRLSYENEGIISYCLLTNRNDNMVYEIDDNLEEVQLKEWGTLFDLLIGYRKAGVRYSKRWTQIFNEEPGLFEKMIMGRLL